MGSMKDKRKSQLAPPHAAETRDARFAGTFEVLVPVPGRNKPHKIPMQFPTMAAAENWMHSQEGRGQIAEILQSAGR
jgi:hypothetical protein